jgi:hypothetical protein
MENQLIDMDLIMYILHDFPIECGTTIEFLAKDLENYLAILHRVK